MAEFAMLGDKVKYTTAGGIAGGTASLAIAGGIAGGTASGEDDGEGGVDGGDGEGVIDRISDAVAAGLGGVQVQVRRQYDGGGEGLGGGTTGKYARGGVCV